MADEQAARRRLRRLSDRARPVWPGGRWGVPIWPRTPCRRPSPAPGGRAIGIDSHPWDRCGPGCMRSNGTCWWTWRAAGNARRSVTPWLEDSSEPIVDHVERAMASWQVEEAVGQLTAAHRTVIVEMYFEGHARSKEMAESPRRSRGHGAEPSLLCPQGAEADARGDGVGAMTAGECTEWRGLLAMQRHRACRVTRRTGHWPSTSSTAISAVQDAEEVTVRGQRP